MRNNYSLLLITHSGGKTRQIFLTGRKIKLFILIAVFLSNSFVFFGIAYYKQQSELREIENQCRLINHEYTNLLSELNYLRNKIESLEKPTEEKTKANHQISKVEQIQAIIPNDLSYLVPIILEEAEKNKIDPFFIIAVIKHESNFDSTAISSNTNGSKDYGLMQINSNTLPYLANKMGFSPDEKTALDPIRNIKMGTFYLGELSSKFGKNMELIATAYNSGPTRAKSGANNYGKVVAEHYRMLQRDYCREQLVAQDFVGQNHKKGL